MTMASSTRKIIHLINLLTLVTAATAFTLPPSLIARQDLKSRHFAKRDDHVAFSEMQPSVHSIAWAVVIASSAITPEISNAYVNSASLQSLKETSNPITYTSMQLASTLSNPIGEPSDIDTINPLNSFGQWFFLIYVAVSLLAGGKEVLGRIGKRMDKNDE